MWANCILEKDGKHSYSIVDVCFGGRKAVNSLEFVISFEDLNKNGLIRLQKVECFENFSGKNFVIVPDILISKNRENYLSFQFDIPPI